MSALEDINTKIVATFGMTGDALKHAREALAAEVLPRYLRWLQNQLEAHGGEFLADHRLTIADLKAFVILRWLGSGKLDHIPADLVETVAPKLAAFVEPDRRYSCHRRVLRVARRIVIPGSLSMSPPMRGRYWRRTARTPCPKSWPSCCETPAALKFPFACPGRKDDNHGKPDRNLDLVAFEAGRPQIHLPPRHPRPRRAGGATSARSSRRLTASSLTDSEFQRLLDNVITPDVYNAAQTLRNIDSSSATMARR